MSPRGPAAHLVGMRLTEHEMTTALTGAAKDLLGRRAREAAKTDPRMRPDPDPEALWATTTGLGRYNLLSAVGDAVLPVLVALPDVDVEPGTRPSWTLEQAASTVDEVTRSEFAAQGVPVDERGLGQVVASRLALVSVALGSLPIRLDPDALLHGSADDLDGVTNGDVEFTVPDTIEGI